MVKDQAVAKRSQAETNEKHEWWDYEDEFVLNKDQDDWE